MEEKLKQMGELSYKLKVHEKIDEKELKRLAEEIFELEKQISEREKQIEKLKSS